VRLRDFPLLTDENIQPTVVAHLRSEGCDVLDVREGGLIGADDAARREVESFLRTARNPERVSHPFPGWEQLA
jgi:hypothetical protein